MINKINNKKIFYISICINFIFALVYMLLTPMFGDDWDYYFQSVDAASIGDLFSQEYNQYMNWTGRSVAHIILRLFYYTSNFVLFDVFRAICFVLLTSFMYYLSSGFCFDNDSNRQYDTMRYVLGCTLVWLFGVCYGETVLWRTGSCNYLITTTILFGALSFIKKHVVLKVLDERNNTSSKTNNMVLVIFAFIIGIFAGWSSENTSGGIILLLILLPFVFKKAIAKRLEYIVMLISMIIGFLFMILAPGNNVRASYSEDGDGFIKQIASRIFLVFESVSELFLPFIIIMIFICVYIYLVINENNTGIINPKSNKEVLSNNENHRLTIDEIKLNYKEMLLYFFIFFATAFALILSPKAQDRAYFGAGCILFVAIMSGYNIISKTANNPVIRTVCTGTVLSLLVCFAFEYIVSGANLMWIYREENERYEILSQAGENEEGEITIPLIRPQFETIYSAAYTYDISEDPDYWINKQLAQNFGLEKIYGIDRDAWDDEQGE